MRGKNDAVSEVMAYTMRLRTQLSRLDDALLAGDDEQQRVAVVDVKVAAEALCRVAVATVRRAK